MKIKLIRNATMKISYAGKTILTDPMLSAKGEIRSFANIAPNPTVELNMTHAEILNETDAILISHTHPDHYDSPAVSVIPKDIPIFCQPCDEKQLQEDGFLNVTTIESSQTWNDLTLIRTGGKHGEGPILQHMGNVSGFILQAAGEPTVYWVGDSIWCEEVETVLNKYSPDIIITHSGGATIPGFQPIIMDKEQTLKVLNTCPKAKVVAVHMESLDHCTVSRQDLRRKANEAGISPTRLLIPTDGEIITL